MVTEAENCGKTCDHTADTQSSSRIHAGNHPCVQGCMDGASRRTQHCLLCRMLMAIMQTWRVVPLGVGVFKHFCRSHAVAAGSRGADPPYVFDIAGSNSGDAVAASLSSNVIRLFALQPPAASSAGGLQHVGDLAGHSARIQAREQTQIRPCTSRHPTPCTRCRLLRIPLSLTIVIFFPGQPEHRLSTSASVSMLAFAIQCTRAVT